MDDRARGSRLGSHVLHGSSTGRYYPMIDAVDFTLTPFRLDGYRHNLVHPRPLGQPVSEAAHRSGHASGPSYDYVRLDTPVSFGFDRAVHWHEYAHRLFMQFGSRVTTWTYLSLLTVAAHCILSYVLFEAGYDHVLERTLTGSLRIGSGVPLRLRGGPATGRKRLAAALSRLSAIERRFDEVFLWMQILSEFAAIDFAPTIATLKADQQEPDWDAADALGTAYRTRLAEQNVLLSQTVNRLPQAFAHYTPAAGLPFRDAVRATWRAYKTIPQPATRAELLRLAMARVVIGPQDDFSIHDPLRIIHDNVGGASRDPKRARDSYRKQWDHDTSGQFDAMYHGTVERYVKGIVPEPYMLHATAVLAISGFLDHQFKRRGDRRDLDSSTIVVEESGNPELGFHLARTRLEDLEQSHFSSSLLFVHDPGSSSPMSSMFSVNSALLAYAWSHHKPLVDATLNHWWRYLLLFETMRAVLKGSLDHRFSCPLAGRVPYNPVLLERPRDVELRFRHFYQLSPNCSSDCPIRRLSSVLTDANWKGVLASRPVCDIPARLPLDLYWLLAV